MRRLLRLGGGNQWKVTFDAEKKNPKIRICSDCSENLHTVKTIIITTPKTFLGVGGFSTNFFGHIHFWSLFHLKVNQPKPNINLNLY